MFSSADFLSNIVGDGELEGIVLTSLPKRPKASCIAATANCMSARL
jgi:hypothetical protein